MIGNRSLFYELDKLFISKMKFGDDCIIEIKGMDKIPIITKDDSLTYIVNFFYITKLKSNLLIIRQLIEKGYETNLKNNICKI